MSSKNLFSRMAKFRPGARHGLFVFMLLAFVILGLRVQEIATGLAEVTPAHAEEAKAAEAKTDAAKSGDAKLPESKLGEAKPVDASKDAGAVDKPGDKQEGEKAGGKADEKDKAAVAGPPAVETPRFVEPDSYTEAEVNILKSLSVRRQELEKRNSELDQREALLKVTEQRVDRKITELKQMQEQVRQAIGAANAEQKARTASLVKIYETMKPKDAARIFENMDTITLLDVVRQMKEARTAPILAAMNPQKAKELTTALMERKPLPAMP